MYQVIKKFWRIFTRKKKKNDDLYIQCVAMGVDAEMVT